MIVGDVAGTVVSAVCAGVILATLGWLARAARKMLQAVQESLPGQLRDTERRIASLEQSNADLGRKLVSHMSDEIRLREDDARQREYRQTVIDGQFAEVRSEIRRVHERIDGRPARRRGLFR